MPYIGRTPANAAITADDLEKGDTPISGKDVLAKGQDIETHKKAQASAAKSLRKKDIGTLYPNNKIKFKNIRSPKMLNPIIADLEKNIA